MHKDVEELVGGIGEKCGLLVQTTECSFHQKIVVPLWSLRDDSCYYIQDTLTRGKPLNRKVS